MQTALLPGNRQTSPDLAPFELGVVRALAPAERKSYSLTRLIQSEVERVERAVIGGVHANSSEAGCWERELSIDIARETRITPAHGGVFVPWRIMGAGLTTKSSGGFLIGEQIPDLLDVLGALNVALRLGAQLIDGLSGQPLFPKVANPTVAEWIGEDPGTDVSQSDPSFQQVVPRPHTLQATTKYSKQLLRQSSLKLESFLRRHLAGAHSRALDAAAIAGPGTESAPAGLLYINGVQVEELGVNGGPITADAVHNLEQRIGEADADAGQVAWATTPALKRVLKQTPRFTGAASPCWAGNTLLDNPALASTAVPNALTKESSSDCQALVGGVWSELLICIWGVTEIIVDPFAFKRRNLVEITSWSACDIVCLRPEVFGVIADARDI
jgi:hypothetical protein